MTPALAFTIASFVVVLLLQAAAFAYAYGRLTMKVDLMDAAIAGKASKETVGVLAADLGKVQVAGERDDTRLIGAVAHLEEYMEVCVQWIGERMGHVGRTLDEHERLIRKVAKASNVSDDRIPAVATETGRHHAIPAPPLRGSVGRAGSGGGGERVPTMPGRDSRRE